MGNRVEKLYDVGVAGVHRLMSNIDKLFRSEIEDIPVYIPGKPIEEVERMLGLQRVIKVASNENPLGPSPKAIAAIKKALKEMNRYPDAASADTRPAR